MEELTGNNISMIGSFISVGEMDALGPSMEDMRGEFGAKRMLKLVMELVRAQC